MAEYNSTKALEEIRSLFRIVDTTLNEGEFIRTMFEIYTRTKVLDEFLNNGGLIPDQWEKSLENTVKQTMHQITRRPGL